MSDAADLASFLSSVGQDRSLKVEENLGEGYVRLRVSEAERRQARHDIRCVEDAVIELLRNARDAGARQVFLATSREGTIRRTVVLDDGSGIPRDMQERVFDARVTSKLDSVHMDKWGVHGRGMALFSIRENALSARVIDSAPGKGTAIGVVTDASSLPERRDQSTWPTIGRDEEGHPAIVRGPHNIVRCCCDFVLEGQGRVRLWVGSAAEIAATIRRRAHARRSSSDLLFVDDLRELGVLERLVVAGDAAELMEAAASVGLDMSERTAHRILSGQVRPLRSVSSLVLHQREAPDQPRQAGADLSRDQRRLRLSTEDASAFGRIMERDFDYLAQRYYLTLRDAPTVRVSGGKVVVSFPIDQGD